jgi:predicted DCC family thiol-disulfide oxidoreductase YuxK
LARLTVRPAHMRRDWKPRATDACPDGTVLFDGVCVLCSWWVRFVIERDPQAQFLFLAIQSRRGHALAGALGIQPDVPETNVVVIGACAFFKSDAAIRILERLPGLSWTRWLAFVPRPLRDWVYDRVARNRYGVFGKSETCLLMTPEIARHFVIDRSGAD